MFVMLSRLFIAALRSLARKGLTSWLSFVMFYYVFVTFPCGILGQVWYLIESIPVLCHFSYLCYALTYYILFGLPFVAQVACAYSLRIRVEETLNTWLPIERPSKTMISLSFLVMPMRCSYWPRGNKTFFMINSAAHDIYPAHKCQNANSCWHSNIYKHDKYNI